jgi:hypothetical protein
MSQQRVIPVPSPEPEPEPESESESEAGPATATATATASDPDRRAIPGRGEVWRNPLPEGGAVWFVRVQEPDRLPSVYNPNFGKTIAMIPGRTVEQEVWRIDPRATIEHIRNYGVWDEIDPRPPSPIHDEAERAIKAGFEAWGAQLMAMAKVKERPKLEGAFAVGRVYVSRAVTRLNVDYRGYLTRHAGGDHGDWGRLADARLDEEARFLPTGQLQANLWAIEYRGRGLVVSAYTTKLEEGRMDVIKVVTLIGDSTYIYSPARDQLP